MRLRDLIFVSVVLGGGLALARGALRPPTSTPPREPDKKTGQADLGPIVAEVNAVFERRWAEKGTRPATPATELAVLRRLSLALTGSIPSLEEIRQFEARPAEGATREPAGRLAPRSAHRRLPGRTVCPRPGGDRGRTLREVSPTAVHDLAQ